MKIRREQRRHGHLHEHRRDLGDNVARYQVAVHHHDHHNDRMVKVHGLEVTEEVALPVFPHCVKVVSAGDADGV